MARFTSEEKDTGFREKNCFVQGRGEANNNLIKITKLPLPAFLGFYFRRSFHDVTTLSAAAPECVGVSSPTACAPGVGLSPETVTPEDRCEDGRVRGYL
ncbi:hypothetical protein CDAR_515521 [Caerostris darwini]|uniref:Uncharacterized protein n=1 Tax=Caerostris darwini TaxID=1538125 RepID=A0AAV4S440_9ARAC|nr:hypothetical protein CDAR_515521 [Caerostris darwini]